MLKILSFLGTIVVEAGKAKKSSFKQPKKVIRKEMIPNWLQKNDNGTLEQVQPSERTLSSEDLAKIERMKQLQEQMLNIIKVPKSV